MLQMLQNIPFLQFETFCLDTGRAMIPEIQSQPSFCTKEHIVKNQKQKFPFCLQREDSKWHTHNIIWLQNLLWLYKNCFIHNIEYQTKSFTEWSLHTNSNVWLEKLLDTPPNVNINM
jgi:hypothetical protein